MLQSLPLRVTFILALITKIVPCPTVLHAQQKDAEIPPLTFRANSRLVMLDVVVTGKKGEPVPDLKAADFVVEENGKKQSVGIFVSPTLTNRPAPVATPPGILSNHPENVGPAEMPIVLVLDAANSSFKEQAYARSQMLKYVGEQEQFGHTMAVVTLTDRMRVLQQFTTDPQALLTAIKKFRPEEPILQPAAPPAPTAVPPDMAGPPHASPSLVQAAQNAVADFIDAQAFFNLERRTLITVEGMRWLSRMLGGLPGRKNVVWLTAELPFDLIPENRTISDTELLASLPNAQSKPVQLRAAGTMAEEQRKLYGDEIRMAEAQLASSNIAIYPVDLHGLLGGIDVTYSGAHDRDIHGAGLANRAIYEAGSLRVSQGTMEEVAKETGGSAYINQNEIMRGVALAAADAKSSYEIGYYPENKKWDGKYHTIKIKVARPDTQLRYRKGYFAVDTKQAKNINYEQDVAAALQFNAPATQVSFKAQAKTTNPGKMRIMFLVDAHTLSAEESGDTRKMMNVSFYASIFAPDGKSLLTRTIKVDQAFDTGTYQQIVEKGMMVPIEVDVPQSAAQLRLAVLDNKTGFIGTASGPIEH